MGLRIVRHLRPVTAFLILFILITCGTNSSAQEATPATVEEAAKALDLRKFPLMEKAEKPTSQSVGRLSYTAKGDCKAAYEFQKKALTKVQWKEDPSSAVTDQYVSAMFTKDGFVTSLTITPSYDPQKPDTVNVMLAMHGNVSLKSLPKPAGLTAVFEGPQVAIYSSQQSVEDLEKMSRQLLTKAGWQSYGDVQGSLRFKQNAVLINIVISAAPNQPGQSNLSYSSEQLSIDIPPPPEFVSLQYADITKQVLFDTDRSESDIVAFYKEILGKRGWKPTHDSLVKVGFRQQMVFINKDEESFTMQLYPVKEEQVLRVTIQHQTKEEREVEE